MDLNSPAIIHDKWFGGVNPAPRTTAIASFKRYWSAYMLFYEREDFKDAFDVPQISNSLQSLSLCEPFSLSLSLTLFPFPHVYSILLHFFQWRAIRLFHHVRRILQEKFTLKMSSISI